MVDGVRTSGTLDLPGVEALQELSRGGFATLYRGWQPAFQRWVAVKVLHASDGLARSQFHSELRALGLLSDHAHVVPVYDAGRIGGRPYLVMPFMVGGSLNDRLRSGRLGSEQSLRAGLAVADALAEAHRLGIVHRDVKPANVLFTAYGVAQLADFGLAAFIDSDGFAGLRMATVPYAAPEVLAGGPATALSDIYSLGATLYAALSGRAPFLAGERETPTGLARRALSQQPDRLERYGITPTLARVVSRAMAKGPHQRFHSAGELRDALGELLPTPAAPSVRMRRVDVVPAASPPFVPPPPPPPPPASPFDEGAAIVPAGERRGAGLRDQTRRWLGRLSGVLPTRRPTAAVVAVCVLVGAGTAVGVSIASTPDHRAASSVPSPTSPISPGPPPTAVPPPTSTQAHPSSPPSAGGVSSPDQIAAPVLEAMLRSYYSLVDQHRLDEAWAWLSPAFQARIGQTYYRQFWESIRSIEVLGVAASNGTAQITLRYDATNGKTSVENTNLSFAIGNGLILISPGNN